MRPEARGPLLAMTAGAGLLLLAVCFNLSHLLIARAMGRQREMSVRAALGAGRGRLLRQLATEGMLLAAIGGAGALLVGRWLDAGLLAMVWTEGTSLALDLSLDRRTVAFAALLTLSCGVLLGLVPAWFGWRSDLQRGLRATVPALAGRRGNTLGRAFVTSQVAVAMVLLVAAGLLAATRRRLLAVQTGLDVERVVQVELNTRMTGLSLEQSQQLFDQLLARVERLPAVSTASMSYPALLTGGTALTRVNRRGTTSLHDSFDVAFTVVTPDHFESLGMPLVRGRGLSSDDHANAPPVVWVNQAFARVKSLCAA